METDVFPLDVVSGVNLSNMHFASLLIYLLRFIARRLRCRIQET
jgi:hypothetical protein